MSNLGTMNVVTFIITLIYCVFAGTILSQAPVNVFIKLGLLAVIIVLNSVNIATNAKKIKQIKNQPWKEETPGLYVGASVLSGIVGILVPILILLVNYKSNNN